MNKHRKPQLSPIPDAGTYGVELAERVASYLQDQGHWLMYTHRDYCGMGLQYSEGKFMYGEVLDGGMLENTAQKWPTRVEFVAWLSRQTDEMLSGMEKKDAFYHNNQRITRARLEEALSY